MAPADQSRSAVSLVVPCYNEEDCLRQTATELVEAFAASNIPLQLVLVDNGSRDATGAIIAELIREGQPVTSATVDVNIGYGNGILEGLKQCTAPFVGFLCADGQVSAVDTAQACAKAIAAERPILVKVRRRFRKDSWRRKLVSVLYNFGMQFVFGWLGSIDLNGNPKVLPRSVLQAMNPQSRDWFLDPEIMIKARAMGITVLENDVEGRLRQGGKSHVRYVTCLEFARNILRYRFGSPLREWKKTLRRAAAQAGAVASPGGSGLPR